MTSANHRPMTPKKSKQGYGLALLMVFIASAILIGTSFQLVAVPGSIAYLGKSSQDKLAAQELAQVGMDAAEADIRSKLNSGTTVDLTYRYPSVGTNTVSAPSDPTNLASAGTSIGTYYATLSYVRGNTYMLKVTATAGGSTATLSTLLTMNSTASTYVLDKVTNNATTAFGLRKLRSAYAGYAIRVRRPSDNATQDIGFTGTGDLDTGSLYTFLGSGPYPLNVVSGASAAFGLRQLSSTYGSYAIRVRRSSDNAEQDIGFTGTGDLDTTSLLSFVGTSSGYVKTWYDQSGNGKNATQTTTANQPQIVNAGVLNTVNNRPAVIFQSSNQELIGPSISAITVAGVRDLKANGYQYLFSMGADADFSVRASGWFDGSSAWTYTDGPNGNDWCYNTGSPCKMWINGTQTTTAPSRALETVIATAQSQVTNTFSISSAFGGRGMSNNDAVTELIFYPTEPTSANRQLLERNQGRYYRIYSIPDGYITTWYDQTGNGRNIAQATNSSQPWLAMDPTTNKLTIYFNGSTYLYNSAMSTVYTGNNMSTMGVGSIDPSSYVWARMFALQKTGDTNEWSTPTSFQIFSINGSLDNVNNENNNVKAQTGAGVMTTSKSFQTSSYLTVNSLQLYINGTLKAQDTTANSASLGGDYFLIGCGRENTTIMSCLTGTVSEFIGFYQAVTTTDRQTVENNQRTYFSTP